MAEKRRSGADVGEEEVETAERRRCARARQL
jgi:hypothetical protein